MERTVGYQGHRRVHLHTQALNGLVDPSAIDVAAAEEPIDPKLEPLEGYWKKEEEHFVAPVSPMFFSIHQPNMRDATRAAFSDFGLIIDHMELAYRAGEVYERDVPLGGESSSVPPWWALAAMVRFIPSLRARMKQAERALRTDREAQVFQQWDTEWAAELEASADRLRNIDLAALDNPALAAHLRDVRELTRRAFWIHFQIGIANLLPIYRLVQLCAELFDWDEQDAMSLLYGSSTGSSVGSRDLDRIARLIDANPQARSTLLDSSSDFRTMESAHPDIAAELREHLRTYGYRMIQNDPMSPTFLEVPDVTLQLLRDRLKAGLASPEARVTASRHQAEQKAYDLLGFRSSAARARFQHTLQRARKGYWLREENVYLTLGHPFALLRFALLEAGQRLQLAGTLYRSSDVFYGTFDEIVAAVEDSGEQSLSEPARRRRLECEWTVQKPGPRTFGTAPPEPDIRGLPAAAREIHTAVLWAVGRLRAPEAPGSTNLQGIPASPGEYRGPARIIRSERDFHRLQPGDVLVCPSTSSSWAVLFGTCAALVTDQGGSLSHPAIIAREHGIPAVVATVTATQEVKDGQLIHVDGTNGRIELIATE